MLIVAIHGGMTGYNLDGGSGQWRRFLLEIGGTFRSSAVGARIEAPKAPRGVGFGEGVSPSPGSRDRAVPPSPENFSIFELKRRVFVHSGCYFCS